MEQERLYTEQWGTEGELFIFLPGITGTSSYWRPRVQELSRHAQVLLVDPLGFGESPKPGGAYTLDRHLHALRQSLEQQPSFTLVGHSMGAMLALAYAARYPEQVKRLVLLSLPFFAGADPRRSVSRHNPFLANRWLAALGCMASRQSMPLWMPLLRRKWPEEVLADLQKHDWRSFTSSLWEVVYRHDSLSDIQSLPASIPVLLLHGEKDRSAPLSGIHEVQKLRPDWQLETLPGAGHHPWLENGEWCAARIGTFPAPDG